MALPQVSEVDAELARRNLLDYARYVSPGYQTPSHIERLAEHLEAVERGEITRLMVSMPPRHGKSMQVSQLFPAWYLSRNPTREIVQAGYSLDISLEHSRKARDIFASERNRIAFPAVHHVPNRKAQEIIPVASQAAGQWGAQQGGRYRAVGVCGGITGFGADLAIIDDPVKNREEAESERVSHAVWDWYRSTLYTRLSPIGAVILCMTRWAKNDLAGRLLDEMRSGGDQWTTLVLPALDNDGAALWPDRFTVEHLAQIRQAVGSHEWSALYMQEPAVRGGNMLQADRIVVHDDESAFPDSAQWVRFWDLASTEKERAKDDPDSTVGALCALTIQDGVPHFWVKHIEVLQAEAPARDERIKAHAMNDGPAVRQLVEQVGGYKDAVTTLKKALSGLRTVIGVPVSRDKVIRAAGIEPIIEAKNFHILKGGWNRVFMDHMTWFPNGSHDDCVDAVSGAHNYLATPQPGFFSRASIGV